MTVLNANSQRPARRPLPTRATLCGLAAGLLAAIGGVQAAPQQAQAVAAPVVAANTSDPAKQLPGAVTLSNIDFKRGDGGAGRLILHFSGEGALPDMRSEGSSVVVQVGNASLPDAMLKSLDVSDFATPVQSVNASRRTSLPLR